ncbi:hypothetical protein AMATHDRAFT_158614 [Amanita thiersii Skay4041]|uniref:Cysteine-rich protein n=1 Tax=Amanita thiersii Skay4041 TaxID=703135 RepID=A0A2A9NBG0_9AGAR|nr:hypothetical protein AMATHDRAFT_158614 [Amanita thiersii Skay4041]
MRLTRVFAPLGIIVALSTVPQIVQAGPILYGICQTGCNSLAVICYAAGGVVFGTVLAATAPAAILACNAAQGSCMALCAVTVLPLPTP